ncbi:MAG: methionine biosynthesis protein MetW [Candidatus Omnitrophota bacterium]
MELELMQLDHRVIYQIVESGAKVLDLGCGDGNLMFVLAKGKGVKAQGIELNEKSIYACVQKGLSVFHGDIEGGLLEYPDQSFDYVILNQSLQETKKVDFVLKEALRVGKRVIVGFPNFAYRKARFDLFFRGRAPTTPSLPYRWHDTPNVHFLSIKDFLRYCRQLGTRIVSAHYLGKGNTLKFWPNLRALNAIFVLTKNRCAGDRQEI